MGLAFFRYCLESKLGLIKAFEGYNHPNADKLFPYFKRTLEGYIKNARENNAHSIKIPYKIYLRAEEVAEAMRKFIFESGREPSLQEVHELTGLKPDLVRTVYFFSNNFLVGKKVNPQEQDLETYRERCEEARRKLAKNFLLRELNSLSPLERTTLKEHCGFSGEPKSLTEMASGLGIGKSWAGVAYTRARIKLRKALSKYLSTLPREFPESEMID